ncbi:MAG: citrate/2-methylcitrate synthase [Clostridia bacterium]|nr:citrate/2-methylcitrate synthase [Clostridia bacterium]
MEEYMNRISQDSLKRLCDEFRKYNKIDPELFDAYRVKRGLRNPDGTGVMAGLTLICNVHGYVISEGDKVPIPGELIYRGINVRDLVDGCHRENRFGFEEVIWLLLFGSLPTARQLTGLCQILADCRELPEFFTEDMIIKAPSKNIMNKLARSVLALYSYDDNAEDNSIENLLRQSIELIARIPTIMVSAYQVKRRHFDHQSMFMHPLEPSHSTAESILATMRSDKKFTDDEAKLLDLCLMLHAEHGGGNNSTFACRVLTSSGTDTYSAIAAAIGSLKGPRHGGANIKVMEMLDYIKEGVKDYNDDEEIAAFLEKMLRREVGDGSGLIYGMGHAVYTLSDPRAVILKESAGKLVEKLGYSDDFKLLSAVERLTSVAFSAVRHENKIIPANVDLYSGLVYQMLGLPPELYTPLFAVARIAGWCAHRIEELTTGGKIIRPAYKAVVSEQQYQPLTQRAERVPTAAE